MAKQAAKVVQDAIDNDQPVPTFEEPAAPKRKRRTKAEIEAERAATAPESDKKGDPWTRDSPSPRPSATILRPLTGRRLPGRTTPAPSKKFRAEAVAKATTMVADGMRAKVKAALDAGRRVEGQHAEG